MKKKDKKKIVIILSVLLIILIVLLITISNLKRDKKTEVEKEAEIITNKMEQMNINELADMNETERMRRYCGKFFKNIEKKDYDEAYELLNEDFKNNFFKTYEEFEEYAKKSLPREIAIEYTNCERLGDIYVLWLKIVDPYRSSKSDKVDINVVIKEHDLDDYELSFSVI